MIAVDVEQSEGAGQTMVELEVFENSSYGELSSNALRKLGLRESERNHNLMAQLIRSKIDAYVRQLSKKVKQMERQRSSFCIQALSSVRTWQ